MYSRTLGLEEELLVVDPRTRAVSPRAGAVLREHDRQSLSAPGVLDQELFGHMLETRTEPGLDVGGLVDEVVGNRRAAAEAAATLDLAVAACGSAPLGLDGPGDPEVTRNDRYLDMLETYGDVARLGTTCGMHVHVAITSEEEGVGCLDRIAPWLPVLVAMAADSPYAGGRDTGYASWRTQQWSAWPSAGPTEAFGSVAGYRRACEQMIGSGAARDTGMLYFDARLSVGQPTLEVRVLDAVTDPEDVGLLAALVRGLVETAVVDLEAGAQPPPPWRAEELRAARWRAARYGLGERLLDPVGHEPRPAREVVAALVDHVAERLAAAGDTERVAVGVERVLAGTGAVRQRAAYERTGSVEGVVDDLLGRTAHDGGTRGPATGERLGSSRG